MEKFISFFLDRARLNYVLLLFLFLAGIYSYIKMPKEIFPPMVLDKIIIAGAYPGTSSDTMDKMAVVGIEDKVSGISGVKNTDATISSGRFSLILELDDDAEKVDVLNKVKDAISLSKKDFPADMEEPSAIFLEGNFPLILVNIASDNISFDELTDIAKEMKSRLAQVKNLTDIKIYGEGEKQISIVLDLKKIRGYQLDPKAVVNVISSMSNIFPLGKIEDDENRHYFISTFNGKKEIEDLLSTVLKIGDKRVYLNDIATVSKGYKKSGTQASFNGERSLTINIAKSKEGNSIELAQTVKSMVAQFQEEFPQISAGTFSDTSQYVRNRLNTVVSNIFFGLILVGFIMAVLINVRISFVVTLGIPTSFIISLVFMNYFGYSINMISLLGALIAIGVIVDDAIIVAENIQRHIEEGMAPKDAALAGAKEVFAPVLVASLTTVFAFIPMLMMTGEMGMFIRIIPISVSVLILASLIESFIFLPLHSKHFLTKKAKELDWTWINNKYKKIITILVHYKKSTIFMFWIVVPLLIVLGFKHSKFEFFPSFDGSQMNISAKLPINTSLDKTYKIAKDLEKKVIEIKDKYKIESVTTIAGFRMDSTGKGENGSNLFHMFVDLYKTKPDNFVEKYITPYLSFDYDPENRTREMKSFEIESILSAELDDFMKKYQYEEFDVLGPRAGVVKIPIEIGIETNDDKLAISTVKKLKDILKNTTGTKSVSDDIKDGVTEIKLKVNRYGESLGISEAYLASVISDYFLEGVRSKSFDSTGIIEIVIEDKNKDLFETLQNFEITLSDMTVLKLNDVATFIEIKNFEEIIKQDGKRVRSVYGDVVAGVTATDILEKIKPTLDEIEKNKNLKIIYGGEKEKNKQLAIEMSIASAIAMFLIFLTLLLMFNSIALSAIILSVVPFSLLGVIVGHFIMEINLTMPSMIGALGLAGVVINDGIIMLEFIRKTNQLEEVLERAKLRLRPILLTSITTLVGLATLIFFPSGQAKILQPLAISLGFGLFWGTFLNLIYLPTLYTLVTKLKEK